MKHVKVSIKVVIVVFVLATIVYLLTKSNHSPSPTTKQQTTQITPSTTTSVSPGSGDNAVNENQSQRPPPKMLIQEAKSFVSVYYLLNPDDTSATRKKRVSPFIDKDSAVDFDLTVRNDTSADVARIQQMLQIRGEAQADLIIGSPVNDDPNTYDLLVPVVLTVSRPDKSVVSSIGVLDVSRWKLQSGQWVIIKLERG